MAFTFEEKRRYQKLADACKAYPPDLDKIRVMLDSSIDLNVVSPNDDEENLLSEIFLGYPDECYFDRIYSVDEYPDGRYLPEIVKLFLEHGFDCSCDNGKAGGLCLMNLTFSSHDKYILDAAKLLLQAGADPLCDAYDSDEDVISWVGGEAGAAISVHQDLEQANLYATLYEIMDASLKEEPYMDISYFDQCIGKRIEHVSLCGREENWMGFFSAGTRQYTCHNCFEENLVIWCEKFPLVINRYGDSMIDPRVPHKAEKTESENHLFEECIGQIITDITFDFDEFDDKEQWFRRSVTMFHLDNGKMIKITSHQSRSSNDLFTNFEIVESR